MRHIVQPPIQPLQWRHAPAAATSSGLALRRSDTHRRGRRAAIPRQSGAVLRRARQDQRFAAAADIRACARGRALAANLLRGIRRHRCGRRVLRAQFRALDAMGRLPVQQPPQRDACRDGGQRAEDRGGIGA